MCTRPIDCTAPPARHPDPSTSTAQLSRFIRFSPNILLVIDEDLRIRLASARATDLLGPIINRNLSTLCRTHPNRPRSDNTSSSSSTRGDQDADDRAEDDAEEDDDQQSTYFELKRICAHAKRQIQQHKHPQPSTSASSASSSSSPVAQPKNLNVCLSPPPTGLLKTASESPIGLLEIYGFEPWPSDQEIWFSCTFAHTPAPIDRLSNRDRFVERMKHVLFESVVDWPIHAISVDRTVSMANHAACESFQELRPIEEHPSPNDSQSSSTDCLFRLDRWRLFDPQFQNEYQLTDFPIERALRGETTRNQQYGCIMPDGAKRILTLSAKPIREYPMQDYPDGSPDHILGGLIYVMDVSHQNENTKQIEQEKEALRAEASAAEDANKSKSAFLSNMSHEIRMPIAVIQGLIDLLLDSDLTTQQRDHAETIKASADGLLTVVGDVLDLSKIESGKITFEHEPFDLAQLISETEKFFAYTARSQSNLFECHLSISPLLNPQTIVVGDRCRIRQILNNLLSNALKFTTRGSVICSIKLEPHQNGLSTEPQHQQQLRLTAEVVDTGIGLTAQSINKLSQFEPFSQADSSTSKLYGGSGLGLCIVKSFVEGLGGQILLESNGLGKGCKVTASVILDQFHEAPSPSPLKPNPGQASPRSRQHSPPHHGSTRHIRNTSTHSSFHGPLTPNRNGRETPTDIIDKSKYSILIAEDNPIVGQITLNHLKKAGFVGVDLVNNGQLALNAILKKFYHPLNQSPVKEEDALKSIRSHSSNENDQQHPPRKTYDLVLLDLKMPLLDGYQTLKAIRKAIPKVYLPVIALSASDSREDKERWEEAQFDDYLSKPIKGDELARRVLYFLLLVDEVRSRDDSNLTTKDEMVTDDPDQTNAPSLLLVPPKQHPQLELKCDSPSSNIHSELINFYTDKPSENVPQDARTQSPQPPTSFVTTPIAIQVDQQILAPCPESTITQFI
ncbi:hypothetical protein PtA15_8A703 [Puccinia triticina]|uniref:Histidine kinase n=1 Tax=Puccinia triticina TaxID=208348 RepID=A0ABY7CR95_9BASI|nr:uncharacterized protein PtA15_8A703 [Puccinia triticina]WAQ87796.1 hypothetical protein PtA15_8A703 [Puccinia triticina]